MSERIYCSQQNPGEPLAGTADRVDVWVLLEHRPTWPARALAESELDPVARRWLDHNLAAAEARGVKARPQLVRQPERADDQRWLFLGLPDRLLAFSGRGYGFLDRVDLDRILTEREAYPSVAEARYFVCTNGRRDLCCARFGLPAYQALRERVGARAWQVTHLGGHRFAPNVLVLPQGGLYGRVTPDVVPDFVATVDGARLGFPWLRGRSWYPPAAQAAEVWAGRSDLTLQEVREEGATTRVGFTAPEGPLVVTVARTEQPLEVLKSCGDPSPEPVRGFRVV